MGLRPLGNRANPVNSAHLTFPVVLALTAAVSWYGDARAACPSHERINTILRFFESREPLRGLRADLAMQDAECGRRRLVEKLTAPLLTFLNAGARLGVVGKPIPVAATPAFADALANMRVVVTDQHGKELARGRGSAILGHPLNAVMWLHEDLARGRVRLKPGDVLSLGSFTPPLKPKAGMTVTVRYEGLPGNPAVTVRFR